MRETIGPYGLALIPLATGLGGLISGLLIYTWAPEAEGHGTDTVVRAFHRDHGLIRKRVPFLKLIASAVTIGSGGAAGREGPTALIAAGFGSLYAGLMQRSESERRLLLLVGMSAGLSAIFRSPIGAALFTIEVLYAQMEFEAQGLLYAMLGSVVSYAVTGMLVGWEPLFRFPGDLQVVTLSGYAWHAVLGAACGAVATVMPLLLYGVRDEFRKIRLPLPLLPALGGLGVGLLALVYPHVLGGGYGWIQEAIDGRFAASTLLALMAAKMVAFSLTIGSGGSGGVFAPSLYVGGMLGGALAKLTANSSPAFVLVGMVSVFGAAGRVPIAALLMVTEMTGGYHMLVPAALAVTISYTVQLNLSRRLRFRTLYEAQVDRRIDSPAHYEEHLRNAVALLSRERPYVSASVGNIDLVSLLSHGIPVRVPGGGQLRLARLRPKSPCVGQSLGSDCLTTGNHMFEVVAVLREESLFVPESGVKLEPDDRLLVISSPEAWKEVKEHIEPLPGSAGKVS